MDEFKVRRFKEMHPDDVFPSVNRLTDSQADEVRRSLGELFLNDSGAAGLDLVREIAARVRRISGPDADSAQFDLQEAMRSVGVVPTETVLVNWYRMDEIERIGAKDLFQYFEWLWYPAVDDIEIFDDSRGWIVSISHEGVVSYWKRSSTP